ncbi:MAG: radical SAM protein [Betaproteobacteria bacterium RBG_16_58_11]|nr:MAG: radical SAM protein [Betaproteobacteria bacterium RBG_16_58_11]
MPNTPQLTVTDHDRDAAHRTYVYPVVSRRAGGVSVGINLNPNNACNWRCIYCQVPNLKRGAAPAIDLKQLETELTALLTDILHGDFMQTRVPEGARRLNDIALSGNGEPTSAKEFPEVVQLIGRVMKRFDLVSKIKLVLITNGSLISRESVQAGLKRMAKLNGEVWYKLDSATREGMTRINNTRQSLKKTAEHLALAASLCPTWVQTCVFALDGAPPSASEQQAYLDFLARLIQQGVKLRGVLLYGIARESHQAEAPRLSPLPQAWLAHFANKIEQLGLAVRVSP